MLLQLSRVYGLTATAKRSAERIEAYMMKRMRFGIGAVALGLLGGLPGCGDQSTVLTESAEETGSVGLAIQLGEGVSVDAVHYTVRDARGDVVVSDAIAVTHAESTVSVRLGLPVGLGYTIEMSADTLEGSRCAGSAAFDVVPGVTGQVFVDLLCDGDVESDDLGAAIVTGRLTGQAADCARIAFYSASPLRTSVGGTIELAGVAAATPAPEAYRWEASSGSVASNSAAETTFTCDAPGSVSLTFTVTGASGCESSASFEVECAASTHVDVAGRLVVADALAPEARVLDPNSGEVLATIPLSAPGAALYTTESGRFVGAVQGSANRVNFIDSGLELEDHGDHTHSYEHAPSGLAFALDGAALGSVGPVHFISHHGWLTVHFDGLYDGVDPALSIPAKNVIFPEAELLSAAPTLTWTLSTAPQHGVSVPTDDGYLIFSQPSLDRARSTLPSGFAVHSLESGLLVQTLHDGDSFTSSCWGMHGEAAVGDSYLYGCHEALDGGILVIERDDAQGTFVSRKIEYPGYPNAPSRTSVIKGHSSSPWAVGQWGHFSTTSQYRGLVKIDPQAEAIAESDVLDLGAVYCGFDFERSQGEKVVALAQNGRVSIIDVESWSVEHTLSVLPDTSTAGTCAGSLALGEGAAFVTRRDTGTVTVIPLANPAASRTFEVPGAPGAVAATGFWGSVGAPH